MYKIISSNNYYETSYWMIRINKYKSGRGWLLCFFHKKLVNKNEIDRIKL